MHQNLANDSQQFIFKYQHLVALIMTPPDLQDSEAQLRNLGATLFMAFGVNIDNQSSVKVNKYPSSVKFQIQGEKNIILWYNSGTFYFGQMGISNNKIQSSGFGFQFISPNFIYEGYFKENKRNGYGKGKWLDKNDIYSGQWLNGKQHGHGTFKNENYFQGNYKQGSRTGYGKLIYKSGDMYEGEWLNHKFHGKGKFTWANGSYHEGEYVNGLKSGKGKWISQISNKNSDVFEGNYENDKKNGYGVYKWSNGTQYKGNYKDGVKEGQGTIKYGGSGLVQTLQWKNDQPIRK